MTPDRQVRRQPSAIRDWTPSTLPLSVYRQPHITLMKTTLLTAVLALSPGLAFFTLAQDNKPDGPREEQKEHPDRERHRAAEAQAREEIEKKVKAALEEASKLEEAGKKDAAENLRREARQMAQAVRAQARAASEGRREGEAKTCEESKEAAHRERIEASKEKGRAEIQNVHAKAEIENKLKHLDQAIAHLREAGLPEPAEHLNQMANRFREALHCEDQPHPEQARREEARREEPRREEARRDEPKREDRRPDNDIEALRRNRLTGSLRTWLDRRTDLYAVRFTEGGKRSEV